MCIVTVKKKGQKPVTYTVNVTAPQASSVENRQDGRTMTSSARCGLVPTGRGHRGLIRGNTAAWR